MSFDPASLNDPIAKQTDWYHIRSELEAKGFNSRQIKVDNDRLEFKSPIESLGATFIFFLLAIVMIILEMYVLKFSNGEFSFKIETVLPLFLGIGLTIAGICSFYAVTSPIIFDTRKGFFWKGRNAPDKVYDKNNIKDLTNLDNIHALQLVHELCISEDSDGFKHSSYRYELNLVLKNGKRMNVVDNNDKDKIRQQADTLSKFLGKPVWDAL